MEARMNYVSHKNLVEAGLEEEIEQKLGEYANSGSRFYVRFSPDFAPLDIPRVLAVYQIDEYSEDDWDLIAATSIDVHKVYGFENSSELVEYILKCLQREGVSNAAGN